MWLYWFTFSCMIAATSLLNGEVWIETYKDTPENNIWWWEYFRVDQKPNIQRQLFHYNTVLHPTSCYIHLKVLIFLKVSKNRQDLWRCGTQAKSEFVFFALKSSGVRRLTLQNLLVKNWSPPVLSPLSPPAMLPQSLFSSCVYAVKVVKVRRPPCLLAALWGGEFSWRSQEACSALLPV